MADRDRNEAGAPENARPRDRTGRPLPRDTDRTDLTETWEYDTVEQALACGRWLWDEHRYFESHECLEVVWHHAPASDRGFWQGVIQVAVACVHHQRGNVKGVIATCGKAEANLAPYPDVHHGVDVEQLRVFCQGVSAAVADAGACIEIGYPIFPAMDDGPWFDAPDGGPTSISSTPSWRAAARQRRADRDLPTPQDVER